MAGLLTGLFIGAATDNDPDGCGTLLKRYPATAVPKR